MRSRARRHHEGDGGQDGQQQPGPGAAGWTIRMRHWRDPPSAIHPYGCSSRLSRQRYRFVGPDVSTAQRAREVVPISTGYVHIVTIPGWTSTRPSPSDSPDSRRTSARPRPRRPGRRCASPRRGAARRRRSSRGPPGWSRPASRRRRSGRSPSTSGRREMSERLDAAARAARRRAGCGPRPDVPRPGPRDPARRRAPGRAARRPGRRSCARSRLGRRGRPRPARHGHLAAQGGPRRLGRRSSPTTRRPVRSPGRSSPTSERSRRPAGSTSTTSSSGRSPSSRRIRGSWRAGARAARTCSSTRSRTSTAPSSAWRCSSRRRRTGSSSSATTTSPSTAGGSPTSVGSWVSRRACRACGGSTSRSTTAARAPVVERAVRLVEHNGERFAKRIRAGPAAPGRLVLAPDPADERRPPGAGRARPGRTTARRGRSSPGPTASCCRRSPSRSSSACRSARPARSAARVGGRGPSAGPRRRRWWRGGRAAGETRRSWPSGESERRSRTRPTTRSPPPSSAGRPGVPTLDAFAVAVHGARDRLAELRRDDAPLTLATAHATKGLEFDHVVVVGMEAGRFPSARAVAQAEDPRRAYEEERRLAYVAWTRARRSLTLSTTRPSRPRSCSRRSPRRSWAWSYDGRVSRLPTSVRAERAGWHPGLLLSHGGRRPGVATPRIVVERRDRRRLTRRGSATSRCLTPLPYPRRRGLVETGVYARPPSDLRRLIVVASAGAADRRRRARRHRPARVLRAQVRREEAGSSRFRLRRTARTAAHPWIG